jgi:hypothetical protein
LVCQEGACSEPGNDPVVGECDTNGFNVVKQVAEHNPAGGPTNFFRYVASDQEAPPAGQLQIQSYFDYGGPKAAGTYSLAGTNFEDCGLCIVAHSNCTDQGCEKAFYADVGSVKITEFGAKGGENFTGSLDGVVLTEVTIDPNTFKSTPVVGGERWCLDGYTFNTPIGGGSGDPGNGNVPAGADDPLCGGDNLGTMVGSSVANFKLQNCNGEWVNLHTECGTKALHIMGTAGWCTACSATLGDIASSLGGMISPASIQAKWPGLKMWIVLSENTSGGAPNQAFCKSYATGNKIDPSILFMDYSASPVPIPLVNPEGYAVELNGFGTLYSFINPYMVAEGNMVNMGVPWRAVLKGENMEYYWSDYYDKNKWFPDAINEVLSGQ